MADEKKSFDEFIMNLLHWSQDMAQTTESIERMNDQVQHLMSDVIALLETIRSEAEGGEKHD